ETRESWKGCITLQAAGLVPLAAYRDDHGTRLAAIVAVHGGLLGGVTRASGGTHGSCLDDIDLLLDRLFARAKERELDVDLHVD
ncbi:cytosine deaminase, partial [Rhizobium ruizarguesonis]